MTQIDILKSIVETNLSAKFVHANLFEANFGVDSIKAEDFPVFVYVAGQPITKEYPEDTPAPQVTISIFGFWLTRVNNPTDDYSTHKVQGSIDQMNYYADKMVSLLNQQSISQAGGITKWKTVATYSMFDAAIFGVSFTADWVVNGGDIICTG